MTAGMGFRPRSEDMFTCMPVLVGLALLLVSQLDLYLFKAGIIGGETLLGWELWIVSSGFSSVLVAIIYGCFCLFRGRRAPVILALINSIGFLMLFALGGYLGGAYVNAT